MLNLNQHVLTRFCIHPQVARKISELTESPSTDLRETFITWNDLASETKTLTIRWNPKGKDRLPTTTLQGQAVRFTDLRSLFIQFDKIDIYYPENDTLPETII